MRTVASIKAYSRNALGIETNRENSLKRLYSGAIVYFFILLLKPKPFSPKSLKRFSDVQLTSLKEFKL